VVIIIILEHLFICITIKLFEYYLKLLLFERAKIDYLKKSMVNFKKYVEKRNREEKEAY